MRGSDLPARRYVAILALRESGASFKEACGEVANRLQTKDKSVSKGFAKFRNRCNRLQDGQLLSLWTTMFNDWLDYTKRNFFDVGIRLGDVADRIRELSNYSKKQSGVKARLYIHHFGEQEPAVLLTDKMLEHAQRALGDLQKAIQFCERWVELSVRAVIQIGPKIEKERSQWADAAMVKDQSFSETMGDGCP